MMASVSPHNPVAPQADDPSSRHRLDVTVNDEPIFAEVESRLLLSDFLRHRIGLTGTHVGCEQGSCGACTVLMDGLPVRSCLVLAVQVEGAIIATVEGLAGESEVLDEVQMAFHEEHAMQCGFCTAGFLMTLASLRDAGADDPDELTDHLCGHLCRCTGYVNIRHAAENVLFGTESTAALE